MTSDQRPTVSQPAPLAESVWFDCRDYPLLMDPPGWPPPWPNTTTSESGMIIELDRDQDHEGCGTRDALRDVFCIMPKGHDTPHMPMSTSLARNVGPLIVRRLASHGTVAEEANRSRLALAKAMDNLRRVQEAKHSDGNAGTATLTEKVLRDCFERENGYPLPEPLDGSGGGS